MSAAKIRQSLSNLENALTRLQEALLEPEDNSLVVDGTIQRFEFVIELFWKTFKRILAYEGLETSTPREALQKAYQSKWIQDETKWLQMIRDRNETSHVYDENAARKIYNHIKANYAELERTFLFLKERFGNLTKE